MQGYLEAFDDAAASRHLLRALGGRLDERLGTDRGAVEVRTAVLERELAETRAALDGVRRQQFGG